MVVFSISNSSGYSGIAVISLVFSSAAICLNTARALASHALTALLDREAGVTGEGCCIQSITIGDQFSLELWIGVEQIHHGNKGSRRSIDVILVSTLPAVVSCL